MEDTESPFAQEPHRASTVFVMWAQYNKLGELSRSVFQDSSWCSFVLGDKHVPFLQIQGSTSRMTVLKPVSWEIGRGKLVVNFFFYHLFKFFQIKIVHMPGAIFWGIVSRTLSLALWRSEEENSKKGKRQVKGHCRRRMCGFYKPSNPVIKRRSRK